MGMGGIVAYAPALASGENTISSLIPLVALLLFASFVGASLGNSVGLGAPLVEGLLAGTPIRNRERVPLARMAAIGVLVGICLSTYELFVVRPIQTRVGVDVVADLVALPLGVRVVGMPLYGGVTEEIFWRFGLVTFLVWLGAFVSGTPDGHPTNRGIWAAISVSAAGFAVIHLTPLFAASALTPLAVLVTLAGVFVFGVFLGWCYWQYGLEASVTVHLATNVVLVLSWQLVP